MSGAAVERFAARGEDLLRLAAQLARETRGAFTESSGPALDTVVAYSEAARNGFRVLASDPALSETQRLAAGRMASLFGRALGTIATRFGRSATVPTLQGLVSGAPEPERATLADLFPAGRPPVSVSPNARAALDSLRRDPLTLRAAGSATVALLMAAAADGVGVRPS